MSLLDDQRRALLDLSHELGVGHWKLAILGEGNTSAKLGHNTFLVKASGSNLATLRGHQAARRRIVIKRTLQRP